MIGSFSPNRRRITSTTNTKPSLHVWVEAGQLTPLECDQFVREMNRVSARRVFIHEGSIESGAEAKAQTEQEAGIVSPDSNIVEVLLADGTFDKRLRVNSPMSEAWKAVYVQNESDSSRADRDDFLWTRVLDEEAQMFGITRQPTPRDTDIPIDLESYRAEQDASIIYPDALVSLYTGEVIIDLSAAQTQTAQTAQKVIEKRLRDSLFPAYTGEKAQTTEIVEFFNECVYGTKSTPTTHHDTDILIGFESYHEPSTAVPTINLPTPVKRGRGRPRKNPLPIAAALVPEPEVAKQ